MSGSARVNKQVFLGSRTCRTRAWFLRHLLPPPATGGEELRMQEGCEIGERARRLFGKGALIRERDPVKAAAETRSLMSDRRIAVIFEATFLAEDYIAKADVLLRDRNGWEVIEVKSNVNLKDELIEDVAYTVKVATHAGVRVTHAKLMLLSPEFRFGMSDRELFRVVDATAEVSELIKDFDAIWDDVPRYVKGSKPPTPKLIWACRDCEFFATDCIGKGLSNHIFELPYLRERAFLRLLSSGITSILKIPPDFKLSENQHKVRQAVHTGLPVIDQTKLLRKMRSVKWPAHYLDFETVKTAVPVLDGLAPHGTLVTQYSVHIRQSPKHECVHQDYLAEHDRDCRAELAEKLLVDLGRSGSIVVYSGYEKRMLAELASLFPQLKKEFAACINRLFDLQKVFQDCFYHPGFCGSTSIKTTLPTLTDLAYDDLEVQDGDEATAVFARMLRGEADGTEIQKIRQSLIEYCKRDTLAMVRLHDALLKHC